MAALVVLAAILAGTPAILALAWHTIGTPWLTPSELVRPDDGMLFVRALCAVGWLAWLTFAWATAAEALAQWRGWRLPALRWQQRVVAGLVASISLMFSSPAIASTGATPVQPAAFQRPAAVVVTQVPGTTTTTARPAATPQYVTHTVARGEQLPQLAQRFYGDRYEWPRIAASNYGITQPDGRSLQPGETRIYPGWQLRIPTAGMVDGQATNATPASTPAIVTVADNQPAGQLVYEVHSGSDWLWFIAQRYLGDPTRYPEIAALNPDLITAKSGPHGPNHIEGGWRLVLPADAYDRGPNRHAQGTATRVGDQPANPQGNPPAVDDPTPGADPGPTPMPSQPASPTPQASTDPAPSDSAPATATATPPVSATTNQAATPATAAPAPASSDAVDVRTVFAAAASFLGAGLLAALAIGGMRRARRRQQQHRRPQRRLPHPRAGATETALLAAQQPLDVDRLDAALRTLAGQLADRDHDELPAVTAASVNDGDIRLHLEQPCPPPPGWDADANTWTLPATVELAPVDGQIAPLPTLTAVGTEPGRHLLIDLEAAGTLHLDGDPERSEALLRYIAAELACNTWSDDVELILAGFNPSEAELLTALNPNRVRAVSSLNDAITRLRRRIATATSTLQHVGAADAFVGRIADLAGDAWMPQVLLVASTDELPGDALTGLAADLEHAGRCAVAVVTAGTDPTPDLVGQRLTVAADGAMTASLPGLASTTLRAAGLPLRELEPLAEVMQRARETADDPIPAAPEPETWAAGTDAAGGVLGLFGRPDPPAKTPPADQPATGEPSVEHSATVVDLDPWRDEVRQARSLRPTADGTPAVPASALLGARRPITAAVRQRRQQADPHLDRDLQAWLNQDPTLVRVGILGPVTVAAPGEEPTERRLFLAEIIVYLAQRGQRGATGDRLSDALWPEGTAKDASRRVAITRARRWLGATPTGDPWLPDMGADRTYRLADGYLLDWHLFRRLRARGEAHGPAGVRDLRAALDLIRGVPLEGADRAYAAGARNPYTWLPDSDIYPGHIVSAIVDTAHQLAELYLQAGDIAAARWAVQQAWRADPHRGDDSLWRDAMLAEHIDGHAAQLRELLGQLIEAREAEVPEDLSPQMYAWLSEHMPDLIRMDANSRA